jgi:V/A-type H+-transporting ATPase subunit A
LKGEFFDSVFLQQNAFDPVDEATSKERQRYVFSFIYKNILGQEFNFKDKDIALHFFQNLKQLFKGWNSFLWQGEEFREAEREIITLIEEN